MMRDRLGGKTWLYAHLSLFNHSARMVPPSFQTSRSTSEEQSQSSNLATSFLRVRPSLSDSDIRRASEYSRFITGNDEIASRSIRDSTTAAATRLGTKGKVILERGTRSGVSIRTLRQIGQSTASCHPPQTRCNREKNHLRMQIAQNV